MTKNNSICPPSPCEGCGKACNPSQCAEYRNWAHDSWEALRGAFNQILDQEKEPNPNAWHYENPALIREYLDTPPCKRCRAANRCGNNETCGRYDRWVAARWERIKYRLGVKAADVP